MTISDRDFALIKKYVYELNGNILGDNKSVMVQNRVAKLIHSIDGCDSVSELLALVATGRYKEEFINAFTTNKTEFFREVFHFEDLITRVYPEHFENKNSISIYCSASSSGEEPYSIAISFLYYKESAERNYLQAKIVATDIDTTALAKAKEGVYKHPLKGSIFPEWIKPQKYFKRRLLEGDFPYFLIKAKECIKNLVEFRRMNLFDDKYIVSPESCDVIFCRNVLIYFSIEDQNKILKKLFSRLKVGGTLYLGHSESPLELAPFVRRLGQNIFVKERNLA